MIKCCFKRGEIVTQTSRRVVCKRFDERCKKKVRQTLIINLKLDVTVQMLTEEFSG